MNVAQILKVAGTNVATVRPGETIATTARLMVAKRTGLAVISDANGNLLGVVSAMEIMRAVGDYGERAPAMPVQEVMTGNVDVCRPNDTV